MLTCLARYVSTFELPQDAKTDHHPEQMFLNEIAPASEAIVVEVDDGVDSPETRIYADFNRKRGSWFAELDEPGYRYVLKRDRGAAKSFPDPQPR